MDQIIFQLAKHYVLGCSAGFPLFFDLWFGVIVSVLSVLNVFLSLLIQESESWLQQYCGKDKPFVLALTEVVESTLNKYLQLLNRLRALSYCSLWSPIYTTVTNDGEGSTYFFHSMLPSTPFLEPNPVSLRCATFPHPQICETSILCVLQQKDCRRGSRRRLSCQVKDDTYRFLLFLFEDRIRFG
jgi:hypothetical protein